MKRTAQFIFFFIISFASLAQTQIGKTIKGESNFDSFGSSISISSDGNILAVGAITNAPPGYPRGTGHTRVYENLNGIWTQMGSDIDGDLANGCFGFATSLSSDGKVLAIGSNFTDFVRVYKFINGDWTQIGSDIVGEPGSEFGFAVSLSSNGDIVAIGAPYWISGGRKGRVYVYKNVSGNWIQTGSYIEGQRGGDQFGKGVALSDNGEKIAIAATRSGAHLHENVSGNWVQVGSSVDVIFRGSPKRSVAISSDGNLMAVGGPGAPNPGSMLGYVKVYSHINGALVQIGSDIIGPSPGRYFGFELSFSDDGKTLLVSEANSARVFKYSNGDWVDFLSLPIGGYRAVSISADGCIAAVGHPAIYNMVKVFSICPDTNNIVSCDSFISPTNNVYKESAIYNDTLTTMAGSDSIVITKLTINKSVVSYQSITACDSINFKGSIYYSSLIVRDTLKNYFGCDSTVITNLTINQSVKINKSLTSCDSLLVNGTMYFNNQVVRDSLISIQGCDSILITSIMINKSSWFTDSIISCTPIIWRNGFTYEKSINSVKDTITNVAGCDSVISLNLIIEDIPKFKLYNVFTPNDDGRNDCFKIVPDGELLDCKKIKFQIFNRWGEQMFETKNSNDCWDGKNPNSQKNLTNGTYFYLLTYGDEQKSISGIVELIR
jgi:gliding motility-associated-like protein